MKDNTEYGIISLENEKESILKILDYLLKCHNGVYANTKSKNLLEARLPHIYEQKYFILNKNIGVCFELYRNQEIKTGLNYPNYKNVGWILKVRILNDFPRHENAEAESYINYILDSFPFELVILKEIGLTI